MLPEPFYLGKTILIPVKQETVWTLEPVLAFRRKEKLTLLPGCEAHNIQPIANRYVACLKFSQKLRMCSISSLINRAKFLQFMWKDIFMVQFKVLFC
jgi:hypothetical protein